ncbi:MAG: dihydropteroate synthase [Pseudomonadota bacterium]
MDPVKRDAFLARANTGLSVMGILNVTPDSFSDGGRFNSIASARMQARLMVDEGADILDIGGESTRPGATPVSAEEEQERVMAPIRAIAAETDVPISIDTYKADTARLACEAGASIINDVWGLQKDPEMPATVADTGAAVVIMHNSSEETDDIPDIMDHMWAFFDRSLDLADTAGIPRERIILDPGIGFGKNTEQNLTIFRNLEQIKRYDLPFLIGLSRKRFIGAILEKEVDDRLIGTVASNLYCFAKGATVFRVHDVGPNADALKLWGTIEKGE